MGGPVEVRVGRLALRARAREPVARVVIDLEDAFRTASLPGARPGELLLVRRLDLGAIRPGEARSRLALRVAERVGRLTPLRLRVGGPEVADAAAVWAPDAVEAAAAAIHRRATSGLRAWWWPHVAPELAPRARPDGFRQVLARVEARHGRAAAGRLLARLAAAGSLEAVLSTLDASPSVDAPPPPTEGPARRGEGPSAAALRRLLGDPERGGPLPDLLPPLLANALRSAVRRWGAQDPRSRWLAGAMLAARLGPEAAVETLRRLADAPMPPAPRSLAPPPPAAPPARPRIEKAAAAPATREGFARPEPPTSSIAIEPAVAAPLPRGVAQPEGALLTPFGGLLFLVNAMRRLGLEREDAALGLALRQRLLADFADRSGMAEDDPLRVLLPPSPSPPPPAPAATAAVWTLPPLAWAVARSAPAPIRLHRLAGAPGARLAARGAGRLVLGRFAPRGPRLPRGGVAGSGAPLSAPGANAARLLRADALLVQRFVRRASGLGWRGLVRRPAAVRVSLTHVDLTLDGLAVDIGVRRAGLDLDPGWVRWLGRVVVFHYDFSRRDDLRGGARR